MYEHVNIQNVSKAGELYPEDVVVREAAVKTVSAIVSKVRSTAYKAIHESRNEDEQRRRMQEALEYAVSALQAIETSLALGRGGYVGQDGETSLLFYGTLMGAAIDRDTNFSVHT
jgi:hypothetical protein